MPILNPRTEIRRRSFSAEPAPPESSAQAYFANPAEEEKREAIERVRPGLFANCVNPGCRSGWLHLWRSRSTPVFEQGWTCSPECTLARMLSAVSREMNSRRGAYEAHRHRVPLGLVMLEQGWITREQLRKALDAQRAAGTGRLGHWLMAQKSATEEMVTRALGLQWSCPVLQHENYEYSAVTAAIPRLFVDAYGALPLRLAAGKVLYLGFEESLDAVLALAVERMLRLQVESGIVPESLFRPVHRRMLDAQFPSVELVEAVSLPAAARSLAKSVERARPVASRLVRVHDCLWLRLWMRPNVGHLPETAAVEDVVCSIGSVE